MWFNSNWTWLYEFYFSLPVLTVNRCHWKKRWVKWHRHLSTVSNTDTYVTSRYLWMLRSFSLDHARWVYRRRVTEEESVSFWAAHTNWPATPASSPVSNAVPVVRSFSPSHSWLKETFRTSVCSFLSSSSLREVLMWHVIVGISERQTEKEREVRVYTYTAVRCLLPITTVTVMTEKLP